MLILGLGTSSLRCKILSSYPPKAPLSLFSPDTKPFLEGGQGDDDLLVKRRKEAAGNCSGDAAELMQRVNRCLSCWQELRALDGDFICMALFWEWSFLMELCGSGGLQPLSARADPHLVWVWRDLVCWRDVWTLCKVSQGSMDRPLPPSAVQTGAGWVPCAGHDARAEMLWWLLASSASA